jgi:hypothetical protein
MMVSNHPGVNAQLLQSRPNPYGLMRDKTEAAQTTSETLSIHGRRANGAREKT